MMAHEDTNPVDLLADAGSAQPRVLLVDDNEQNLELLQAYLEDLPCEIVTATDGIDALARAAEVDPDVIVLDIMMPRMSGFQVCERVKADKTLRDIPVIMVTALNEVGDVERAVDAGADDFLTKPVNRLELVTRVTSLMRVRQLKRQLDHAVDAVRRMRNEGGSA
ncbi:MAG: response regulator [Phycisphaeraceae bacterium]|nr:response regulator [Phycisphaeraceae bacterium]MCW5762516.1 response regulator [Phycisphaeraceae bacterium]